MVTFRQFLRLPAERADGGSCEPDAPAMSAGRVTARARTVGPIRKARILRPVRCGSIRSGIRQNSAQHGTLANSATSRATRRLASDSHGQALDHAKHVAVLTG